MEPNSKMELNSNRSKGQNAYICPVVPFSGHKDTDVAIYPKPLPGHEDAALKGKFFKGEVDKSTLKDRWYYYYEANFQSTRGSHGYLKIEKGEIVKEVDHVDEILVETLYRYFPDLKPLIGTPKQVKWAESIRAKEILYLWEQGYGESELGQKAFGTLPGNAKYWIEDGKSCRKLLDAAYSLIN